MSRITSIEEKMQIYLSETHIELVKEVRAFAEEVIAPVARELDEASEFPWETVKAIAERGFLGVPVPCEFGGMGRDYLSYILVVEEIAKVDASHAITVSAHTTFGTTPILTFGTDE
jgi:alkylation response protein AidB-like acyl-CoA dehydrogenase